MRGTISEDDRKAYSEVFYIINNMNVKYTEKVPDKLMDFFTEVKDDNYEVKIDRNTPLFQNDFQPYTFELLNVLNLNFWCEDKERKQEIAITLRERPVEFKFNNQLKEIYKTSDNVFKEIVLEAEKDKDKDKEEIEEQISNVDVDETNKNKTEKAGFLKKIQSFFGKKDT